VQQGGDHGVCIEVTLLRGPQNAGQDLLRLGALWGAIAAAVHLPRDHRRTNRLFGAPVRGVEGGIDEEAEDRGQLGHQMACEALHVRKRSTGTVLI
jgi:hypothetical protein